MKKRRLLLAFLLLITTSLVFGGTGKMKIAEEDTIIVTFGKKGKMVIYVDNKEDFKALKSYDLNELLSKINLYLDSTYQDDYMNDTTFTFNSPYSITSTTTDGGEVRVRVETFDDRVAAIEKNLEEAAENLEKATKEIDKVKMRIGSIHVDISSNEGKEKVKVYHQTPTPKRVTYGFDFYLGLNNYFQDDKIPSMESTPYALSTFRSRYFAVDFKQTIRIAKPLYFSTALELAFNNYMFRDDVTITKGNGMVDFPMLEKDARKSKLATTYLNVPVMLTLKFERNFMIGVGGYVGHRLSSHSKIKYSAGNKDKDRSNFYLNEWRYGVRGVIGTHGVKLFMNYDLNPMFRDERGPGLNAISFGIMI